MELLHRAFYDVQFRYLLINEDKGVEEEEQEEEEAFGRGGGVYPKEFSHSVLLASHHNV